MSASASHPIGIFDSGVGGLTVLRAVQKLLPSESLIYLGDTARVPYGDKSPETVTRYALEDARFLEAHNVKAIVVACNTATAHALETLRDVASVPVLGVVEPGVKAAVAQTKSKKIAVLGTRGTIRSETYQRAILARLPDAKVLALECPLFVPLVEERFQEHPAARLIAQSYIQPILEAQCDTVILGCTHYPILQPLLNDLLGPYIHIVDAAAACAQALKRLLNDSHLLCQSLEAPAPSYYVTDAPEHFQRLASGILSSDMHGVQQVSLLEAALT